MIFNLIKRTILVVMLMLPAGLAVGGAKLNIVTTVPDLAWAAQEIGGDFVTAQPLLRGTENPHYVDALPNFVRLVADADIVCVVGLDLEVGYMPAVLSRSGNAKVQPGGKGYCEVGKGVQVLEKPQGSIDRSMGDVHPAGNPHFWLGPKAFSQGAVQIAAALTRMDPSHAQDYKINLTLFQKKLSDLSHKVSAKLELLVKSGIPIVEYHKEFIYFLSEYKLKNFGSIEEKPGVPPSAGRLATIATEAKGAGVRVALAADYSPTKTMQRFHELSGIQVVTVPTMISAKKSNFSYQALQLQIAESLVDAVALANSQNISK